MDLLFSKYASPFLFIDGSLQIGRFSYFVDNFIECENEKQKWDFYLHKVFDKTYKEFQESLKTPEPVRATKRQLETTVKNSITILDNFNPNEQGV